MPVLIVQRGHCYRKTGATGTAGEQAYATAVADACFRLLHGRSGWTVRPTLADENYYRGDAFVAIHCDGSTNSSARGASVGYRTPEGQAFGQAWKRAYQARGWTGGFRPDNYTTALAQYYGTGNAVAVGNRRAFIAECGFRTNPEDRALLDAPGGPERVALAIGDALGIPTTSTENDMTPEEHRILAELHEKLVSGWGEWSKAKVYEVLGDVVTRAVDASNAAGAKAEAVSVQLDELADRIADEVQVAVAAYFSANPPVVNIDHAALARAVNDDADLRARDNDPATGPRS